ncbi:PPPDE putative peptidase domain-containing protein [Dipodascopsis tothii]|uniref:PPPDE putative peptidase domain-containing protein n=1 Tax=Dipodascopsis tothii TaxID=44089 RepID=UPI0034CE0CFE
MSDEASVDGDRQSLASSRAYVTLSPSTTSLASGHGRASAQAVSVLGTGAGGGRRLDYQTMADDDDDDDYADSLTETDTTVSSGPPGGRVVVPGASGTNSAASVSSSQRIFVTGKAKRRRRKKKRAVVINVYDLLQGSRMAGLCWALGVGVYHSAVEIDDREYAYGGHDEPGVSGVYYSRPKTPLPGGLVCRLSFDHADTTYSAAEVRAIVSDLSHEYLGTGYNLVYRNCNHFTDSLVTRLTGKPAPAWLNRATIIGAAVPCLIPQLSPPESVPTAPAALYVSSPPSPAERPFYRPPSSVYGPDDASSVWTPPDDDYSEKDLLVTPKRPRKKKGKQRITVTQFEKPAFDPAPPDPPGVAARVSGLLQSVFG